MRYIVLQSVQALHGKFCQLSATVRTADGVFTPLPTKLNVYVPEDSGVPLAQYPVHADTVV